LGDENQTNFTDLNRWGLSLEAIADLGQRLQQFWRFYGQRTRDTRQYGFSYVSGLLRLKSDRCMAGIAREAEISEQNRQHFMSHSPWSGRATIAQVQDAIMTRPELEGGMLLLDESADAKAGDQAAGAGRQHNGRLGKVDQSQVGVYLAYVQQQHWTLWDAELFIPEGWFAPSQAQRREKAEIPGERVFQTKIELGWDMIAQAQAQGLSCVAVAFDSLYGRSHGLRQQCDQAQLEYYADIPNNYPLYLTCPQVEFKLGKRGQPTQQFRVIGAPARPAAELAQSPDLEWVSLTLRTTERGWLGGNLPASRSGVSMGKGACVRKPCCSSVNPSAFATPSPMPPSPATF